MKKKLGIIIDSGMGYLDKNNPKYADVEQVYFYINDSDGNEYIDDYKSITTNQILNLFEQGKIFKTAAVSPGQVMAKLNLMLEKYEQVLVLTVSSGLSSYHNNILYLQQLPEYLNKVFIVDTKEVGYPMAYLLDKVLKMHQENASLQTIITYAKKFYLSNYTAFSCENWSSLAKSGRVPKSVSKILGIFKTRPLINFYIKNRLGGISKSFEHVVEKILVHCKKVFSFNSPALIKHVVFYNNQVLLEKSQYIRKKIVQILQVSKDKIKEMFVPNLVLVYTANQSFGVHIRFQKLIREKTW